ncbi:MAG TPA: CAP domain-containing protein [Longimicrobium sp.]|nr:CAP domain-containing protein [Longimicrobium sp.]
MMIEVPSAPITRGPAPAAASAVAAPCLSTGAVQTTQGQPTREEREFGRMLEQDPGQQRERIVYNPILARVARQRAQDLAARNYFSHTDPDGLGANTHVTRAGYRLPDSYDRSPAGNNIESIGGGYQSAWEAWQGLINSKHHRTHLLGLEAFYREQSEYGVGYARAADSEFEHYWVVLIAKPAC